nr:hypothetical protein [Granulosicoccus sp.]
MFQTTKKVAARMLLIGTALLLSLFPLYSFAQTHIYVVNGTGAELLVRGVQIGGDAISKKAWKKGVSQIADGDKKKVLAVNRTGKFNWMDPTPRFVEPGKTTTFTVE